MADPKPALSSILGNNSAPPSPTATPASSPSTPVASTSSFPTTPTGEGLGVNGIQVANMPVSQFLSDYDISSTEENTYVTLDSKGDQVLTENAIMLMQYKAMDAAQRQDVQQSMVNAGLLTAGDADGDPNSASISAFKSAITTADTTGTDVNTYLQNYSGSNYTQNLLSGDISDAEKAATEPTHVTLENPTTLSATITQAFNQALGYSPDQGQIQSFISQIQGQDTANATNAAGETPAGAEAQLAQLHSDQSKLSSMGTDDIDAISTAYLNAIHGVNPTAGNTNAPQGPVNGSSLLPGQPGSMGPMGPVGMKTTSTPNTMGVVGALTTDINRGVTNIIPGNTPQGFVGPGSANGTNTSTNPTTPSAPQWQPGPGAKSVPTYGGIYAMSPADWAEAKKLLPNSHLPATPGVATAGVQETAWKTVVQNIYDNNGGSMADALIQVAGGTPAGASKETVSGSKANLHSFAVGVVSNVEQQVAQITNNAQTSSVVTKTDAPDAGAEAAAAAKQADPVGYYAANAASAGSLLNQMLAGAPQMSDQSTADTFTGPVPTDAAASPSSSPETATAPAPVAA